MTASGTGGKFEYEFLSNGMKLTGTVVAIERKWTGMGVSMVWKWSCQWEILYKTWIHNTLHNHRAHGLRGHPGHTSLQPESHFTGTVIQVLLIYTGYLKKKRFYKKFSIQWDHMIRMPNFSHIVCIGSTTIGKICKLLVTFSLLHVHSAYLSLKMSVWFSWWQIQNGACENWDFVIPCAGDLLLGRVAHSFLDILGQRSMGPIQF